MAALLFAVAGCTGDDDSPAPRTLLDTAAPTTQAEPSTPAPVDAPGVADSALDLALLTVPARAEFVSFTDVSAVKRRLGYADLTGQSLTSDRFDFWERARAYGGMVSGTRLYDYSSVMSIDYGWTAEDVDWEVDFSSAETGCLQSMLCERASGYVLALRKDLSWESVLTSLRDNGFEPEASAPDIWSTSAEGQPFERVLLIPELRALASGNDDGILRVREIVSGGADSVFDRAAPLLQSSEPPESAYLDLTGCVTLGEALGPDATPDDLDAFFKKNDASGLADPSAYAVLFGEARAVEVVTQTDEVPTDEQVAARQAVVDGWQSLQGRLPLTDVAQAMVGPGGPPGELTLYVVSRVPAFVSMVLTHDAPWALCATVPPA